MKIELNDNNKTITVADLNQGDTFLHRGTEDDNTDSVFILIDNSGWTYATAIDLANGEELTLERDEIVIPIKVKIVLDT